MDPTTGNTRLGDDVEGILRADSLPADLAALLDGDPDQDQKLLESLDQLLD
jgi:hypothetical protein